MRICIGTWEIGLFFLPEHKNPAPFDLDNLGTVAAPFVGIGVQSSQPTPVIPQQRSPFGRRNPY